MPKWSCPWSASPSLWQSRQAPRSLVAGGLNQNAATGRDSIAQQQSLTMGGTAGRRGLDQVFGGQNRNSATGRGAFADRQVVTIGAQ